MKKKVLFLSLSFPLPPDSGGKIKTLNTLQTLASRYQLHAVFISGENSTLQQEKKLTDIGITFKNFCKLESLVTAKEDLGRTFKNMFFGHPYYRYQYTYPDVKEHIDAVVEKYKPYVIHVDHIAMAQYLPKIKRQIWILEAHNVESHLLKSRIHFATTFKSWLYLHYEWRRTYVYEKSYLPYFDHVFSISLVDKKRLENLCGIKSVTVQPVIYPVATKRRIEPRTNNILFIGSLIWPPNFDAANWFLREIYLTVMDHIPTVQFHVVGKVSQTLMKKLPQLSNVHYHGYQASIDDFLKEAAVFVLPFRTGGGVRIKGLVAFAHAIPVVSTPLGIEGLSVIHERECLIANNSTTFSLQVLRLLVSKKLQYELSKRAQIYLNSNHGEVQNVSYLQEYGRVIQKFS